MLHLHRRLLAHRRASPALVRGEQRLLDVHPAVLAFHRALDGDERLVVCNLGDDDLEVDLPAPAAHAPRRGRVAVASDGAGEGEPFTGRLAADHAVVLVPERRDDDRRRGRRRGPALRPGPRRWRGQGPRPHRRAARARGGRLRRRAGRRLLRRRVIGALAVAGVPAAEVHERFDELDFTGFVLADVVERFSSARAIGRLVARWSPDPTDPLVWIEEALAEHGVETFRDLAVDDPDPEDPPERRYRLVVRCLDVVQRRVVRLPWDYERYGLDPDEQSVARPSGRRCRSPSSTTRSRSAIATANRPAC
jgi:hypothetical protein